jgi:hypothetical protein
MTVPLSCSRLREIRFADASCVQQGDLGWNRHAPNGGLHDAPLIEEDDAFVLAKVRGHAEHARLPAQVEQLEDVMNAELAKRSLDRHG